MVTFPVSVDTIEAATVQQVFADMGLEIPPVVIPVVDEAGTLVFEDVEGTARAHLAVIERGEVDAALTCLAGTRRVLLDAGVTTWRIDHARVTLVEALQRAWLASEVKKSKGSAIAVVLVGSKSVPVSGGPRPRRRSGPRPGRHLARPADGSWVVISDDRFMLTTTQAAVEETLGRFRNGQSRCSTWP